MLWTTLVLSAVAVGPAAADHEDSDEWVGSFHPALHSTVVTYAWSLLQVVTFTCDTAAGCILPDDPTSYDEGDTTTGECEYLGSTVLVGDCSTEAPTGWEHTSTVTLVHDPPTWSLRFCTQEGWGQDPLYSAWGTTDGPINGSGHRATLDSPPPASMWGPLPTATTVNEPPFCGDWEPAGLDVSIADATVEEGGFASLTITATGTGSGTVQFATADGTAVSPGDYTATLGVHSWSGPGTREVVIETIDDDIVEGDETFTVSLSNAAGVDIGTGTATVTILDNDCVPGAPSKSEPFCAVPSDVLNWNVPSFPEPKSPTHVTVRLARSPSSTDTFEIETTGCGGACLVEVVSITPDRFTSSQSDHRCVVLDGCAHRVSLMVPATHRHSRLTTTP